MIGIKELAERLEISIGTVSRALNNKPDVNPETRVKVLDAAKRFGYVANQSGRSLRQGTTNTIGLMLSIDSSMANNTDNFFLGLTEGIQNALQPHELDLIVLPCPRTELSSDFIRRIIARRFVDGLIITSTQTDDPRLPLLKEAKIPFVSLGRSETTNDFSWVDLDFEWMVKTSIDRLVASGHSKIGVVLPEGNVTFFSIYLSAYRQALQDHNIPWNENYICRAERNEKGGYDAAGQILSCSDHPTAMLLIFEQMAEGFFRRLQENGLTPGKDMAVIGFRNQPNHWNIVPKMTSFHVDVLSLGMAVGRQLLSQIPAYAPTYSKEPQTRIWPIELVPGESDPPPLWRSGTSAA